MEEHAVAGLLGKQAVAVLAALAWAFTISDLLAWLVRVTIGFRVSAEVEAGGIDEAGPAETAYEYSPLSTTARAPSVVAAELESTR